MSDKIIAVPCVVEEERGDFIRRERNTLQRARWHGMEVVVKDFGRPFLHGLEYAMRTSKACRSYEHARTLIERSIGNPEPIAYRECRDGLTNRLKSCSYICRYEPSQCLLDFYDTADSAFIHAFAAFVAELHEKGIRHDDLNNTNVRVKITDNGPVFSLIDLNRMHIYPDGQQVPLDECLDNMKRCADDLDDRFMSVVDEYLRIRNLPPELRDKAAAAKKEFNRKRDRKVAFKKKLKQFKSAR